MLRSYLKYNYKSILISFVVLSVIFYFDQSNYFLFLLFALNLVPGYFDMQKKLAKLQLLKARGLTEEDVENIEFVKKWEETRKEGLRRYCLRDGGIITGTGLAFVVGLVFFLVFRNTFKGIVGDPGSMFLFIGYSYMAGALTGVILFRILWYYKERKFIRLTDPLHTYMLAERKYSKH